MSVDYIWDDNYAIAKVLREKFLVPILANVTKNMIFQWTLGIGKNIDDPEITNEKILIEILQEWFEETLTNDR